MDQHGIQESPGSPPIPQGSNKIGSDTRPWPLFLLSCNLRVAFMTGNTHLDAQCTARPALHRRKPQQVQKLPQPPFDISICKQRYLQSLVLILAFGSEHG